MRLWQVILMNLKYEKEKHNARCVACRDSGTCDLAFYGQAGQFCPTTDGAACCCSLDSTCLSTSQCICSVYEGLSTAVLCCFTIAVLSFVGMIVAECFARRPTARRTPSTTYEAGDNGELVTVTD